MAVSFSGISTYVNCPSAFKRKYVTKEPVKLKDEVQQRKDAPQKFRGTDIHNSVEDYLLGKKNNIHHEIAVKYSLFCSNLKQQGAKPEMEFGFNAKWESVPFEDPTAQIRGKMDCTLDIPQSLNVYEWKTGKEYDTHSDQRNLYGLAGLILHPHHEKVIVTTVYFDLGINRPTTYSRNELSSYKWVWERKINKTKPPQPYPMRPSWKCRNCDFSKKNGGKCPN